MIAPTSTRTTTGRPASTSAQAMADERTRYRVRIAKVTAEVAEVLGADPTARSPRSIAEMVREEDRGRVWNFHAGEYEEVGK